jgi:Ca2+-binding EF-hand superfamily protein
MAVADHPLVVPIRRIILKRNGGNAVQAVRRAFNALDEHRDYGLSSQQFKNGLRVLGVVLTDQESNTVQQLFDIGNGSVSFNAFLAALKGPLSDERRHAVLDTWAQFNKDAAGCMDAVDLQERYDPSRHPLVRQGLKTQNQVLTDVVQAFNRGSAKDKAKITEQEFLDYYAAISANIEDDALFGAIVRDAWLFGDKPQKSGVRLDAPLGDHPLASVTRAAYNPAEADMFFETKLEFERPEPPRRVTGFTGYVVGVQETFGMTFQKIDAISRAEEERLVKHRPPPAGHDGSGSVLPNPRAALNRTTFKLE